MTKKTSRLRGLGVLLLACGVAAAQNAPVGPPVCKGAKAKHSIADESVAERRSEAKALATEKAGVADPHNLVTAVPPMENFGAVRDRLVDYAQCVGPGGCYWADVDAASLKAEAALDKLVATKKPGEKLAMVFDIDETTLSAYCEMPREDWGYIDSMFEAWVVTPAASVPIPGSLRLFRKARSAGVSIFFITGRPGTQRAATARNLKFAGYSGWSGLGMRTPSQIKQSTLDYKSAERQKIIVQGYRLIMNVGDQWSDLNGTAQAELNVKMPNPFYFLP